MLSMMPASQAHDGSVPGRLPPWHTDRRRLVLLCVAAVFLGLAIVFGAIAFFRITAQPASGQPSPSSTTLTMTASAAGTSGVAGPTPVITFTKIIDMPAPGGSDVGAIETAASTLASVVAAICAVIALRPQAKASPAPAAQPPGGGSPA